MSDTPLVVSQRSWHYRLLESAYPQDGIPKTLCGYFWSVIFAPLIIFGDRLMKWTVIAAVKRIVSLGAVPAAIIFTAITASALTVWGMLDWESLGSVTAILVGIAIVSVVVGFVGASFLDLRKKKERPKTTSTARLLIATVKAKKRRICPLIETAP